MYLVISGERLRKARPDHTLSARNPRFDQWWVPVRSFRPSGIDGVKDFSRGHILNFEEPRCNLTGTDRVGGRSVRMIRYQSGAIFLFLLSFLSLPARAETGLASFYDGGRTASGVTSGPHEFTAAHRTLPFGTKVVVTNARNGRTVTVRITDRGPYGRGRIIDVSRAAARQLDMIGSGTALVSVLSDEAVSSALLQKVGSVPMP